MKAYCLSALLLLYLEPQDRLAPLPGQRCAGRNYAGGTKEGGRRCCTPEDPCDEGQGDCDGPGEGGNNDGHQGCKRGLECGSNNCRQFGAFYHPKDDCCERPSNATERTIPGNPHRPLECPEGQKCCGRNKGGKGCCSIEEPCGEGKVKILFVSLSIGFSR